MKQFTIRHYDEEGGIHEGKPCGKDGRGKQRQPFSLKGCRSSAFLRRKRRVRFFRARPFASRRAFVPSGFVRGQPFFPLG